MAEFPQWIDILSRLGEVVVPVVTYLLGRAQKSGSDLNERIHLAKEFKKLERTVEGHTVTLSAHTVLHGQYAVADESTKQNLLRLERQVDDDSAKLRKVCVRIGVE